MNAVSDVTLLTKAVRAAASVLEEAKDELCRLDAAAGDGDEGLAMATAARSIQLRLDELTPESPAQLVRLVAQELGAVGGAMGALSYVMTTAIADQLGEGEAFSAALLSELLAVAEAGVAGFGGASRGDKSILDAIGPAREAAEAVVGSDESPAAALVAAAEGAARGAQATAAMEARIGRASRLGERSRGTVDAGARTFALVIGALAETYLGAQHGDAE